MSPPDPKIIVALDFDSAKAARQLMVQLDASLCRVKVGKELFTNAGPAFVEELLHNGFGVFLDLKFHDIPNTVANACKAAADLGVWMMNVHALGGQKMMSAAVEAIQSSTHKPLLIAVTILTSMSASDIHEIGLSGTPADNVATLAKLANDAGLDGVVCSPMEVQGLRTLLGTNFQLITPGVRPTGSTKDDQARTMTPVDAIRVGANYLVIGRPITQADNPLQALRLINTEIAKYCA
ncbi:MAG: orotidine-5'-phosphate decarboxylase [Gammaproteobacteria bacterium]|nr:orotidine-5'-phosphate decarboxylase [Gammaproteobacteria bacterium]